MRLTRYAAAFWGTPLRSLKALILAQRAGMRDRAYEEAKNRYVFMILGPDRQEDTKI